MAGSTGSRVALAATFIVAAARYWFGVFHRLTGEARRWHARAAAIPHPVLRDLALDAQRTKRRSLDGAAAFAAFAPRRSRPMLLRALIAYQVMFDYLDTVSEQPSRDPISNGRQLNQALVTAVEPQGLVLDYYAHHIRHHRDDGRYLQDLINATRAALSSLPSYVVIAQATRHAAERIREYQSLNHGDIYGSYEAFSRWAHVETDPATGLRWWETGAAAGSSTPVLALIAAAADPRLGLHELTALADAYYPWAAALHTLLDSLVDQQEDSSDGQRSLLDYYTTPQGAAAGLGMIAAQALKQTQALPTGRCHRLILAAMASFYLSDPNARTPNARLATKQVLDTMGELAIPTMLVFRAQRATTRLARHLPTVGRTIA